MRVGNRWLNVTDTIETDRQRRLRETYEQRRAAAPDTADGQLGLADWCAERGLTAQETAHLNRILQLAPDHAAARQSVLSVWPEVRRAAAEQLQSRPRDYYVPYMLAKLSTPIESQYQAVLENGRIRYRHEFVREPQDQREAVVLDTIMNRRTRAAGMGEMHVDHASAHVSHWHNSSRPHDVNQDQQVTPVDALVVINSLNVRGPRTLSDAEGETTAQVDVNGDSQVTPADCLTVVNELNQPSAGAAAVEDVVEEPISDEPSVDETTVEDGTVNEETADDGTADDGTADDGTADDGTADDGTVDDGTSDNGTVDDGTIDDGTVDDGTVDDGTADDLPGGHHGCGDGTRPSLEDLFPRADANGDGVLTEDELPQQLWARLSAADTDSSGGITLEELIAFKPEGGPHGPRHDGHGDRDALDGYTNIEEYLHTVFRDTSAP